VPFIARPTDRPSGPLRWAVTGGGLALIGLELWWFLGKPRQKATAVNLGDRQQVQIQVEGGYYPDTILVQAGRPLTLIFQRSDSNDCLAEVQFPAFGVRRSLPVGQQVSIDLPPLAAGEYGFACGMNMFRGRIIAQP
jgi:plastocyanin domain-containing protein